MPEDNEHHYQIISELGDIRNHLDREYNYYYGRAEEYESDKREMRDRLIALERRLHQLIDRI